jgi:hypothetical protein
MTNALKPAPLTVEIREFQAGCLFPSLDGLIRRMDAISQALNRTQTHSHRWYTRKGGRVQTPDFRLH